jgi:hypothetical protein
LADPSAVAVVDRAPRFGLVVGADAATFWIADRLLVVFVDICPSVAALGAAAAIFAPVVFALPFDR